MSYTFVTAIVSPPFMPSLLLRLENCPIPGQTNNYRIFCQRPSPRDHRPCQNPQDDGVEQEEWEIPIPSEVLEEFQTFFDIPITIRSGGSHGLDLPCYELMFGDFGNEAHYKWAGGVAQGWEPLRKIVSLLLHHGCRKRYPYDYR